jgi:GntR family transcriptional regulator
MERIMAETKLHRLQAGPTTMYAQLASILRGKILTRHWKSGHEIPTLMELCHQYDVARVTARQAVQTLVAEGLLTSQRGRRTSVCYSNPEGDAAPLFTSIGSILSNRPAYSIKILSKDVVEAMPQAPFVGRADGRYLRIRKVDCENGIPYAYSENYLAHHVAKGFSDAALAKTKLARLIRDRVKDIAVARDRIFVGAADYEEARLLDCPMSATVANVERVFCDSGNGVIYFGKLTYRGDRFAVEHDILPMLTIKKGLAPSERKSERKHIAINRG